MRRSGHPATECPLPHFASEDAAGAHPAALRALVEAGDGFAAPYGADGWTAAAVDSVRRSFSAPHAEVRFAPTRAGALEIALAGAVSEPSAIVCAGGPFARGHVAGASWPGRGTRPLVAAAPAGKMTAASARAALTLPRHSSAEPRVLALSQATAAGTVYSVDELRDIACLAREWNLVLHLDGDRLANAADHLGVSLSTLTRDIGIDVVSFGGTGAGVCAGEAVIFLRPDLAERVRSVQRQAALAIPKLRFLAAPLAALLDEGLWFEGARHANAMAGRLAALVRDVPGVEIVLPVQANLVFARVAEPILSRLLQRYSLWVPDPAAGVVRFAASWATQPAHVDALVATIADLGTARGRRPSPSSRSAARSGAPPRRW